MNIFTGLLSALLSFLIAAVQCVPFESINSTNIELPAVNDFVISDFSKTVKFYFHKRSDPENAVQLHSKDLDSLKAAKFDKNKITIFAIHGFMNSGNSKMPHKIKDAVLKFKDANVFVVDWNYITRNPNYFWVVSQVPKVGNFIGEFVNFLIDHGLRPDRVHVIGHSLGAHVAGFIGKTLEAKGRILGRITGLDPASPDIKSSPDDRLSSSDARFVDCIHTCAGYLGMAESIGHVDFYPNGGVNVQPGCHLLDGGTCSHGRSYDYFVESLDPKHRFIGQKCESVIGGVPYGCINRHANMGYYVPPLTRGVYYLRTASSSPFALDIS